MSDDKNILRMPPSKSHAIRAILAASLAFHSHESALDFSQTDAGEADASGGHLLCDDIVAALSVAHALGAHTRWSKGTLILTAAQTCPSNLHFDCGESALLFRTMLAVAPFLRVPSVLERRGTLLLRPVNDLIQLVQSLGAQVTFLDEDRRQLQVTPILSRQNLPSVIPIDSSATSQNATGMLFALTTFRNELSPVLVLRGASSRPYWEMTLDVLNRFGLSFNVSPSGKITRAHGSKLLGANLVVEPDWSAAAFFLVLLAIFASSQRTGASSLKLPLFSAHQADAKIAEYLEYAGARIHFHEGNLVSVEPGCPILKAFEGDLTHTPDLLPPLCALALFCRGTTHLTGIERTRHKESDRPATLLNALNILGAHAFSDGNDALVILGNPSHRFQAKDVDVYADHRIAMALAIILAASQAPHRIPQGKQIVAKSFPRFFDVLHALLSSL